MWQVSRERGGAGRRALQADGRRSRFLDSCSSDPSGAVSIQLIPE